MENFKGLTAWHPGTIFLAALSLSIGWGIRGNFGHEYGAMIPGALAAIAICLLSGRQDWRERVAYFAFFGALGWGFGGSISYMQVVSYTHSGHLPSQIYGFAGVFAIGFLWAAMGGAGTAFPAVADKKMLAAVFRPLCWIFVGWVVFKKYILFELETLFPENYDPTWSRQAAHTYWLDSDWMETTAAILALLAFELWDNRGAHFGRGKQWILLPVLAVVFALAGLGLHIMLEVPLPADVVPVAGAMEAPSQDVPGEADVTLVGALHFFSHHAAWIVGGALLGVLVYCFFFNAIALLPALLVAGALIGFGVQALLEVTGAAPYVASALVQHQASADFIAQAAEERGFIAEAVATGLSADEARDVAEARVRADQLINWPNAVLFYGQHVGWFVGALVGLAAYFIRFGRFGSGASLFMHMALGWFGCFLLFPVLLGHPFEDGAIWFRMTPPRGDNWAGILGVVIGTGVWLVRYRYVPVLFAMLATGILGGFGFALGTLIKLCLVRPGNPQVVTDPEVVAQWAHWQQSNWHSVMEQTQGFLHGLAIAIAMAMLATRAGRNDGPPTEKPWTAVFAAGFVLFGVTYLNMYKNVLEWVKNELVPETMAAPLFASFEMSAWGWFNLIFGLAALAGIALMSRHTRAPVALVPASATGKGQMLYLALLAAVVVMNFERALPGFHQSRLITEGMIFVNGTLAAVLILLLPRPSVQAPMVGQINYESTLTRTLCAGLAAVLLCAAGMTTVVRAIYGEAFVGHAGKQMRFGEEAEWRIKPTEKSKQHS